MKVLIPTDGSDHARAAIELVAARCQLLGRTPTVLLLNVQPAVSGRVQRAIGAARLRELREEDAKRVLQPAVRALAAAGIDARTEVRAGSPGERIAEFATEQDVDLIVMGARGLGEVEALFLGSETGKVLAGCTTPVLVVRAGYQSTGRKSLRVGIAVDGSSNSDAAVRYVLEHTDLFGEKPEYELINVVPDFGAPSASELASPVVMYSGKEIEQMQQREFERALERPRRIFRDKGLVAEEVRLADASPGDAIAAYAKKRKLDCLAIGTHGSGRFLAAVLGSVALRVAAQCDTPLLLIRER